MSQSEIAPKPSNRNYSFLIGYGVIVPKHAFVPDGEWANVDSCGAARKRPLFGSFEEKLHYFLHWVLPPLSCGGRVLEDGFILIGHMIIRLFPYQYEELTLPSLSEEEIARHKEIVSEVLQRFGLWTTEVACSFRHHKLLWEHERYLMPKNGREKLVEHCQPSRNVLKAKREKLNQRRGSRGDFQLPYDEMAYDFVSFLMGDIEELRTLSERRHISQGEIDGFEGSYYLEKMAEGLALVWPPVYPELLSKALSPEWKPLVPLLFFLRHKQNSMGELASTAFDVVMHCYREQRPYSLKDLPVGIQRGVDGLGDAGSLARLQLQQMVRAVSIFMGEEG